MGVVSQHVWFGGHAQPQASNVGWRADDRRLGCQTCSMRPKSLQGDPYRLSHQNVQVMSIMQGGFHDPNCIGTQNSKVGMLGGGGGDRGRDVIRWALSAWG